MAFEKLRFGEQLMSFKDKTFPSMIPDVENTTPDYYCTWQTQLYATCDGKPAGQRAAMNEKSLFDPSRPNGWSYFYKDIRRDLYFVMDDSWDVPTVDAEKYYGCLILNKEKFPSFAVEGDPAASLANLSEKIREIGWKGLGGWVCIQECELFSEGKTAEEYWEERVRWSDAGRLDYWKVDWGKSHADVEKRALMTKLAKEYAPHLTVEHAMRPAILKECDVFRTYDVPALMSIPMTMEKIANLLKWEVGENVRSLINCEDEVYVAAALGMAMGVMRHPYTGDFMNGKKDMSFPSLHRNLKTKIDEVSRAVNWHKIAPAFKTDPSESTVDERLLTDQWVFENLSDEIEEWWTRHHLMQEAFSDNRLTKSGNARISRRMPLADVIPDQNGEVPYVVNALNPNGAVSVATLGRTKQREYYVPRCEISLSVPKDSDTFGIFGFYGTLNLKGLSALEGASVKVQDLKGKEAYDITALVKMHGDTLTLDGNLIERIGTSAQTSDDTSEPGMLLKIERRK